MGKDVKRRFTVSLDIETKDIEKQIKATASNVKTILADLGKASDKMGYFKELVDYIGQIDTALTSLQKNNKASFDHMFDGLDENLKKVMESIFHTSSEATSALDMLRSKINEASANGAGVKDLRAIAEEINSLFTSVGKLPPIDLDSHFTGRGDATKRIAMLRGSLDAFAETWSDVNNKIKQGFSFGGTGGLGGFSEEIQRQIDELNRQIKDLENAKAKFDEIAKTVKTVQSKGDKIIPDSYKADLTIESIQKLIGEFDSLKTQLESGDKSSSAYYNNLTRMTEVVLTLRKALSDIRADDSIKELFVNTKAGKGETMLGKLSSYANTKGDGILTQVLGISKDGGIDSIIRDLFARIETIKTEALNNISLSDDISLINIDAIKKEIDALEKQANRLKEIKLLFQDIEDEKQAIDAGEGFSEEFEVEKTAKAVKDLINSYNALSAVHKQFVSDGDTSSADYFDNLTKLSKVALQIQELDNTIGNDSKFQDVLGSVKSGRGTLLDSLENTAMDIGDFFETTFEVAARSIDVLINESQTKLQSLRTDLQKVQDQSKIAPKTKTGTGSGAGSGGAGSGGVITNVDFTSLENTIRTEIANLSGKLDEVFKVEVVKNDTNDIQKAIGDVKSAIDRITTEINNYKDLKENNEYQAQVEAMKGNLSQLLQTVSDFNNKRVDGKRQQQELGAAIMSDGSISIGYGEDGTVPWEIMAQSLLKNLNKSLLVDVHSHPWEQFYGKNIPYANDNFSGSSGDLGAFRFSKDLGAQIGAMITGNILRTFDVSKLTDREYIDFRAALANVEKTYANTPQYNQYMSYKNGKLYYKQQASYEDQHKVSEAFESLMYKAFEKIGFSKDRVDQDIFKKYNLTDDNQLTELAERLVLLSQSSQSAINPVQRLSTIIEQFKGDTTTDKAQAALEAFNKGELSAAQVFNVLNGKGYKISQKTIDSMMQIDTANEIPAIESLLTQVASTLDAINNGISNIDNNTRQNTHDKFETAIGDILDIRNGLGNDYVKKGIRSLYDPLNVSEYRSKAVMKMADESALDAMDSIKDLYDKYTLSGTVDAKEMSGVLDKFYKAVSNVQDAIQQVELYEKRTGKKVTDADQTNIKDSLNDTYAELINKTTSDMLTELLSQAKANIRIDSDAAYDKYTGAYVDDSGSIVTALQSINSILDSIYGVLHGFTGIEAHNRNALNYREPVVDNNVNTKTFSDNDMTVLSSILQVLQDINAYLHIEKVSEPAEKIEIDNAAISEFVNGIASKLTQQIATEDTLQAIKGAIDQIISVLNTNGDPNASNSLNTLVSALTANITALNDATNGIIKYRKEQKNGGTKSQDNIEADKKKNIGAFNKYKKDINNVAYLTEDMKVELSTLEELFKDISTAGDLSTWIERFDELKKRIADAKDVYEASNDKQLSDVLKKAKGGIGQLDFKPNAVNLSGEQQEIVNKYNDIQEAVEAASKAIKKGESVNIGAIQAELNALNVLTEQYKDKHKILNASGNSNKKAPKAAQIDTARNRYKALVNKADAGGFGESDLVKQNIEQYTSALNHLISVQSQFRVGESLSQSQEDEFRQAQIACADYARELQRLLDSSIKLQNEGDNIKMLEPGEWENRKQVLQDYVREVYGSSAVIGNFDKNFTKLLFTVKNGDGTFTNMSAAIDSARTRIVSLTGSTGQATSGLAGFFNEVKKKIRTIGTYFAVSFGWQEVWQQIRQGIGYIKEIDTALVELKKVTNESEATYNQFLQTMSKSAGVIGSTVSELTTMASEWARLGYSIEDAGKLAESTAILLNVSEFGDATAASEALISTMQAFQYTADESQHVVDILNEVGNNYAVSSDGIATALQDSASALMEAGNNLEQSVALVAAANKVVQDPNSVGSALRTISLRLRGTSVEVLEELGEETDGAVASVSKLQKKIGALTGVNILTESGEYKDTYTILREIGEVWEGMNDVDQAALLELMAGI